MAYQAHIVVPTSHERAETVIDHITTGMAIQFGGYSRYDGSGGWDAGEEVIEEEHVRLVANVTEMDKDRLMEYMRIEAEFVKDVCDEDAVLIEIHGIDIELV